MSDQAEELITHSHLQPRRAPQQDRSKDTVERILDATAELLDEMGHTKLTTKRVAKRCGVNIATLYNYFPNKLALLRALAVRTMEELKEELDAVYDRRAEMNWREVVDNVIDAVLEFSRDTTGFVALSLAMRSYPSLRQIDHQSDLRESESRVQILFELGVKGSPRELQLKALMIAEVITAMIDYALQYYPERAEAAMVEVKRMVKLYIEDLLRESAEDSSSENKED